MKNSPYYTIWFSPTKTIIGVLSKQIKFRHHLPILIAVISSALGSDIIKMLGFGIVDSILTLIAFSVLVYIGIGYLLPWWIMTIGKIWKGNAKFIEIQIVFGLAYIPTLFILIYQLIHLSIGVFLADTEVNYAIRFIVAIFYFRTIIIGIAKTQGFTYGLAIINLIVSVIPLIIIRLIIG